MYSASIDPDFECHQQGGRFETGERHPMSDLDNQPASTQTGNWRLIHHIPNILEKEMEIFFDTSHSKQVFLKLF